MKPTLLIAGAVAVSLLGPEIAAAGDTSPQALIDGFAAAAGRPADPAAGGAFFAATHTGGKPDTPSCTTCHTPDPTKAGQTRTGKVIDPLAPRANPVRFTDTAEVEKWFGRNCNSVLGRECTPGEKADVTAWLAGL